MKNPFEFEGADKLSIGQVLDFFTDDFNYARFILSKRNVFLMGERGTGKTMTIRYYSLPVYLEKQNRVSDDPDLDIVCIHTSCHTPLTLKREYELLESFSASVLSEHFLVVSIMDSIVRSIRKIAGILDEVDEKALQYELEYILGIDFPSVKGSFFDKLILVIAKMSRDAQKVANSNKADIFFDDALSFSSGVLPVILCLRKIPRLKDTHFALMLDDVHDLNKFQVRALNSWIAYRDNTMFSFKIATANVDIPDRLTKSGGAILPSHDFIEIDMSTPYRSKKSSFGKLARDMVKKRLEKANIMAEPDDFFPCSPQFEKDLEKCKNKVEAEAKEKYKGGTKKQIADHVYKYSRVEYFRDRVGSKANRPPYSGFDLLVHMSTGVIRNLLLPCYFMYDRILSERHSTGGDETNIHEIPPSIQTEVILERSKLQWEWMEKNLANTIDGCSVIQGKQVYQLFDNLAILFRERLLKHKSEPRAVTFTISQKESPNFEKVIELLRITRKAQLLYTYSSSAKDSGKRETYYAPNRLLWPERSLDPHGQHARVSIKADDLWNAAKNNTKIPTNFSSNGKNQNKQQTLWK